MCYDDKIKVSSQQNQGKYERVNGDELLITEGMRIANRKKFGGEKSKGKTQ